MSKRKLSEVAEAVAKPAKVVNVAYGEVNKAGVSIPADAIPRATLNVDRSHQLRVVGWNLNGMRSFVEKRGDHLKKLWETEDFDILGITETKITDEARAQEVEAAARKLIKGDVKFIWNMCSVKKGYAGSLAIVKADVYKQCKNVSFGLNKKEDPEGRTITLEFANTAVVIAYVPNSGMQLDRLAYRTGTWDKHFSAHCKQLSEKYSGGVIIAGDLNVAHRDMDIWNVDAAHIPKLAGTTPQERKSFQENLLSAGFIDTFAHMHPDKKGWFTYWSIKAGNKPKNRGLRLDYVLTDKQVKVLDAFIACESNVDGDHCPVGIIAEVDRSAI